MSNETILWLRRIIMAMRRNGLTPLRLEIGARTLARIQDELIESFYEAVEFSGDGEIVGIWGVAVEPAAEEEVRFVLKEGPVTISVTAPSITAATGER